jgi:MraZ protein
MGAVDPLFSEDYDAQAQAVVGESQFLNFDDEGRVRLPDEFIAHAGITDRVTFVGMIQKFQMWDPARFEPVRLARIARARATRIGGAS